MQICCCFDFKSIKKTKFGNNVNNIKTKGGFLFDKESGDMWS